MTQVQDRPQTSEPSPSAGPGVRAPAQVPLWRLNLLRLGYLELGAGLAVVKWPLLLDSAAWGLEEGTIISMLVAMSVLALLGLRYPLQMLPILLFEVGWKLLWLGLVALPLWSAGDLGGATLVQTVTVLWFVLILAVVPWRHVVARYVRAPGAPWRRGTVGDPAPQPRR